MSGSGRQSSSCLQNLGHIGSPKHGKRCNTRVYDPYHIPLPAMSRKVLKLGVGSFWLQIQVMVGSWISGLSVDHTLLFHVQLSVWTEAGQCEGKISMNTPKKITGPAYRDAVGVVGTVRIPVLCFPGTGQPRSTQLPSLGILPFPPLLLSAICTACAHDGPTPAVTTVPRDYHKHLPLRFWRWLWNDLLPEKKFLLSESETENFQNHADPNPQRDCMTHEGKIWASWPMFA